MADETQPDIQAQPEAAESAQDAPVSPVQAAEAPKAVAPVVVTQYTRRGDSDALPGQFVDVVAGDYAGRRGAYVDDAEHDPGTGYPSRVIVRTRDEYNELIVVNYADVRPSAYTGGR